MELEKEIQANPVPALDGGLPFPVVGIGASAGGYAALMTLLQNMPPASGMALVVILHLAADEPSAADKVLQMGSDGTAGLACIKEMGGATIAQLPSDAEYGGMPHSAIESGMADFVLAASAVPAKLAELRDIASAIRQRAWQGRRLDGVPLDVGPSPDAMLRDVLGVLRERTGHDFTHYRPPTLLRRLERRLQVRGMPDLAGYYEILQRDSSEPQALLKDLLIGVTSFYRDRDAFDALERQVLPALFQPGREAPRAWVAACSSGEEAYTVAMLLAGQAAHSGDEPAWQVFGSDLDDHAIEVARAGLYPASIAEAVPAPQLQRWFTREG